MKCSYQCEGDGNLWYLPMLPIYKTTQPFNHQTNLGMPVTKCDLPKKRHVQSHHHRALHQQKVGIIISWTSLVFDTYETPFWFVPAIWLSFDHRPARLGTRRTLAMKSAWASQGSVLQLIGGMGESRHNFARFVVTGVDQDWSSYKTRMYPKVHRGCAAAV